MNQDGVIPNRFPDNYHTSDASLWFIHALARVPAPVGDDPFMEKMKPVIGNILENYPSSPVASLDHEAYLSRTKKYVDGYRIHATGGKAGRDQRSLDRCFDGSGGHGDPDGSQP